MCIDPGFPHRHYSSGPSNISKLTTLMELEKLKLPKGVELTDYQKFRQDFVKLFGRKPTEEEIWEAATHAARQPQKL